MENKKYKILMDITAVKNFNSMNEARSGIFSVSLNLLKEFLKHEELDISLFTRAHYYQLKKAITSAIPYNSNIKILTESRICALYNHFKSNYKTTRNIKFKLLQILLFPFALLTKGLSFIYPNKYNADIFFSAYDYPPYSIIRQKNLKKFILLHDCIPILDIYSKNLLDTHFNHYKKKLFKKINKENFYFTNSEYTRHDFIKYHPNITEENTKTVLLAASEYFYPQKEKNTFIREKYSIPLNKRYIFSLCTLEPRKNLIREVRSFVTFIKNNHIDDMIFVIGGGHWEKFILELSTTIDNLEEYKNKIFRIGYVSDDDLPGLYSSAEWFVYTSQYEGFGLPPLEAMSCGCPVIVSNSTSLPEVVGTAGLCINYDSDEEHIKAYETYYYNPEIRKKYAKNGLERAKQFSYKKTADEIIKTMLSKI